jgi:3-oxoadipate enol-lactonase
MPFADLESTRIHYELSGSADLPVLVLSNSLGTNFTMWAAQLASFSKSFRLLRYDTRGHGQSSVTLGPYAIEQLANDVVELLDHLELACVYFCGLSMGGLTGMWMGIHTPERLHKIVMCNTALKIGNAAGWNTRIDAVRKNGMQPIAAAVLERWFSPAFRIDFPQAIQSAQQMLVSTPVEGYVACCEAIRDADFRAENSGNSISSIRVPTLVVAGAQDPVTTLADGRAIVDRIPGAQYLELQAAHLSNIEAASAFTMEVGRFLTARQE